MFILQIRPKTLKLVAYIWCYIRQNYYLCVRIVMLSLGREIYSSVALATNVSPLSLTSPHAQFFLVYCGKRRFTVD